MTAAKWVFLVLFVFFVILAVGSRILDRLASPPAAQFPQDLVIVAPDRFTPADVAVFSGKWSGRWQGGRGFALLAVIQIEAGAEEQLYEVRFGYGYGGGFRESRGTIRRGELLVPDLSRMRFRASSDGRTLKGSMLIRRNIGHDGAFGLEEIEGSFHRVDR